MIGWLKNVSDLNDKQAKDATDGLAEKAKKCIAV